MFRDVLILVSSAAAGYAWLCAIVSPVHQSVHSLWFRALDTRAWRAFALACGGAVVWTLLGAVAVLLFMMLEPRLGLALLVSRAQLPGLFLGNILWGLQWISTDRMPRLGDSFEVATALALTAVVKDDPRTLARVEALYRAYAVAPAARSRGVYGLAA
jgi:hypothetical protein